MPPLANNAELKKDNPVRQEIEASSFTFVLLVQSLAPADFYRPRAAEASPAPTTPTTLGAYGLFLHTQHRPRGQTKVYISSTLKVPFHVYKLVYVYVSYVCIYVCVYIYIYLYSDFYTYSYMLIRTHTHWPWDRALIVNAGVYHSLPGAYTQIRRYGCTHTVHDHVYIYIYTHTRTYMYTCMHTPR